MPTKKKLQQITSSDFEKGLMLAGLLTPMNVNELTEKEAMDEFEKNNITLKTSQKDNIYFRRVVLAAEIVDSLHQEPTFGRVKFQKLVYLCEYIASLDVHERYKKLAAGPFDNKFMHSIIAEFEKQGWFIVEKISNANITRSVYKPLPGCVKYKNYYNSYYKNQDQSIQRTIELFRTKKTDFAEISATLVACYLELTGKGTHVTENDLLKLFYEWSKEKARFERSVVLTNWLWLQQNELVPTL